VSIDLPALTVARDHVAKGALSMIDYANHKPENRGKKPKVGGHQASSMSSVDLLSALYLGVLRAEDRVAVKPHAAPILYSLGHLMGVVPGDAMSRLREFHGLQPYPTRSKDPVLVDYTTSSEALGVCATIYDAYAAKVHDAYAGARAGLSPVRSTYFAHCGDGELTEGQIDESLYDAGRWGLDNLVWVVDLNRQSLDRVMDDSGRLEDWVAAKFRGQGWSVRTLRWGARAEALFAREGGPALKAWLDRLPDALFHPLLLVGGATVRRALLGEVEDGPRKALLERLRGAPASDTERAGIRRAIEGLDDAALAASVSHLGGHDLAALIDAYEAARAHRGGPVVIVAHTVKGWDTSGAGHPENHGALLPEEEVAAWGLDRGLAPGPYPVPDADSPAGRLLAERGRTLFHSVDHGWLPAPHADVPGALADVKWARRDNASSGEVFQALTIATLRTDLAPYVQFGAPDVGQTTHLGPVIRQTGVFAPRDLPDAFDFLRDEKASSFHWRPARDGQVHALGIAEGNAMLWAYAFGRRVKAVEGRVPFLPIVTVYDKFFERGFNQIDYATYSNARFVAVGVPSGTGLSRETATHQSTQTPRMMMDLPGILAYEPAFGADVEAIWRHALGSLWSDDGEAFYLRLTTQPVDQPVELPDDHAVRAVQGAWWLVGEDVREPTAGEVVLFVAAGRKVADCRKAAAILHERGIGSRILNVTSYEALWRDWDAYASDPEAWDDPERSCVLHDLFDDAWLNAPLVMVGDHVPSVAEWLPSALQRVRGGRFLGPRANGEAGDLESIDHLHGMAVGDIVAAAKAELAWQRHVRGQA